MRRAWQYLLSLTPFRFHSFMHFQKSILVAFTQYIYTTLHVATVQSVYTFLLYNTLRNDDKILNFYFWYGISKPHATENENLLFQLFAFFCVFWESDFVWKMRTFPHVCRRRTCKHWPMPFLYTSREGEKERNMEERNAIRKRREKIWRHIVIVPSAQV